MKTPTIFVAHGAPPLLDDPRWMAELKAWADALPAPKAVLMLSAHWEERPITLGCDDARFRSCTIFTDFRSGITSSAIRRRALQSSRRGSTRRLDL